jgi:hypothetical protein
LSATQSTATTSAPLAFEAEPSIPCADVEHAFAS